MQAAESPDKIPLTGEGALGPRGDRRWVESFGIALAPFIGVTVARFVSSGFTPSLLSPVDLSFGMLCAAAVLAVQLVENQGRRGRAQTIPALVYIVVFAVAFTSTAIATTDRIEGNRDTSRTATSQAQRVLGEVKEFILAAHQNPTDARAARLSTRVEVSSASLADASSEVRAESGFTRELLLVMVLSGFFLAFTLRVWSRL